MHLKRELKVLLLLYLLLQCLNFMHLKRELKDEINQIYNEVTNYIMHLKRELKDTPAIAFTHSLDTCI